MNLLSAIGGKPDILEVQSSLHGSQTIGEVSLASVSVWIPIDGRPNDNVWRICVENGKSICRMAVLDKSLVALSRGATE